MIRLERIPLPTAPFKGSHAHREDNTSTPLDEMPRDHEMNDPQFCRGKEADYYAKAKAETNPRLKSAYEAAAREYAYRVRIIEG